jgi:DNA-binding response OmpR family regulator
MVQKVLIIEDDLLLANTLQRVLAHHHFVVTITSKIQSGFGLLENEEFQLVVLDLNLPDGSGFKVLDYLSQYAPAVKVMIISQHQATTDRVEGFERGAADFVSKPCDLREFLSRVERLSRWRLLPKKSQELTINQIRLLPDSGQVFIGQKEIKLRRREFQILEFFAHHQQRVITTEELLLYVWGAHALPVNNTIQVYISKLRKMLGQHLPVETIRGMGYRINR